MNTYDQSGDSNAAQQREGRVARGIEQHTAKVPSDVFMWAAGAAMIGSLAFQIFGRSTRRSMIMGTPLAGRAPLSMFIGQWVPTLLIFGLYNKIVKVAGSDRYERERYR